MENREVKVYVVRAQACGAGAEAVAAGVLTELCPTHQGPNSGSVERFLQNCAYYYLKSMPLNS